MHRGLFHSPPSPNHHVFMLYNIKKSFISKFLAFFLAVPIILRTFAIAYKIVVIYSAMATVSPRLHAVGFFYAYKVSFSRQREKGLFNMAVA
jgi:hypothetical protein